MNNLEELTDISKILTILYIEDDDILRKKTSKILEDLFKIVDCAVDGKDGFDKYEEYYLKNRKYYDIVITDIKMPYMDGVEISKEIKKIKKDQHIIITSAHDESKYLIEFINIGIDKFIKKPFSLNNITDILLDVCKGLSDITEPIIKIEKNLIWCKNQKLLKLNKEIIKLSNSETKILDMLLSNIGQVFSKSDLYYCIKDDSFELELSEDSIKAIIKRIRGKLPKNLIANIYGQGYTIRNIPL
ncbi:MAG: response regulator [Campylobacterota bacterium]|nr:response regulator [Campylobacterota bacterium]